LDKTKIQQFEAIFSPRSVAVIGASDAYEKWGFQVFSAVRESYSAHPIYAVNATATEVQCQRCWNSIIDIPEPVDLAVITVPASQMPSVMDMCVKKRVKAAVIITGDFAETGEDGSARQQETLEIARRGGIRIVGPNVMGHVNTGSGLVTTPFVHHFLPGRIAIASQSGNVGVQILQYGFNEGVGFSKFVGTGNEADLTLEDFLEYYGEDPDTDVIGLYIEGLKQGRRFMELAHTITAHKPIVALKAGSSITGASAARSHTQALAGADIAYEAAFRQCGIIRVSTVHDMLYTASALIRQPLPRSNRVGIITIGGGIGVMAADACARRGLSVPALDPATIARIGSVLPVFWSHGNPVDTVGNPSATNPCTAALLDDPNVDSVLVICTPELRQVLPNRLGFLSPELARKTVARFNHQMDIALAEVEGFSRRMMETGKPVIYCKANPIEEQFSPRMFSRLRELGWIVYPTHDRAVSVIRHLVWYGNYQRNRS
jgi:acyl-CoA synthetase (NDP forming)